MRLILSVLYNTLASWQRNTFDDVITHSVTHCKSNNHPFIQSDTCTISKHLPKTHCSIFSTGQRAIHSKAGWGRWVFDWCWLTTHQQLNGQASHIVSFLITSPLPPPSSSHEDDGPAYRRRRRFVRYTCNTHDSSKQQNGLAFIRVHGVTFQKTAVCIRSTGVTSRSKGRHCASYYGGGGLGLDLVLQTFGSHFFFHKIAETRLLASSRLSVRMEQVGSHSTDFHEILHISIFRKYVETFHV